MSLEQLMDEDRRITILRAVEKAPDYELNESILHTILGEFGLACSRDKVKALLSWLEEQGLITTRSVMGCTIARLTNRGLDVAQGNVTHPGVKRPAPKG